MLFDAALLENAVSTTYLIKGDADGAGMFVCCFFCRLAPAERTPAPKLQINGMCVCVCVCEIDVECTHENLNHFQCAFELW